VIFVQSSLQLRDRAIINSAFAEGLFLGFLGAGSVVVESNFKGTIYAPNASLILGSDTSRTYQGEVTAKNIELRPDSKVVHRPFGCF